MLKKLILLLAAAGTVVSLQAAEVANAEKKNEKTAVKAKKRPRKLPADGGLKESTSSIPRENPQAAVKSRWHKRWDNKRKQIAQAKNDIQIVLIGDSITHYWERKGGVGKKPVGGLATFKKYFSGYRVLNLGYGGDRTGNTIWMVQDSGLLDQIRPSLAVVMIGTNNLGHRRANAAATAAGVKTVVEAVRKKLPETNILLFGVFPRAASPQHEFRQQIKEVNDVICKLADDKKIFYCDITDKLLEKDGTLSNKIMPDYLHPNDAGYEVWAQAIMPYVQKFVDKK